MPNVTFVASANAVAYLGAEPVLFDIDQKTWQLDLDLLETFLSQDCYSAKGGVYHSKSGARVAAVMAVHVQGNVCDMDRLCRLCDKYELPLLEDAAEALGSKYNGKYTGTLGDIGCFSFNGNKIISTGGGGMLIARDDNLQKRAKHLATTAKTDPMTYFHDEVGYNYRLVNVLSAIGLAQLEKLDAFVEKKRQIAETYRHSLRGVGDIGFQKIEDNVESNEWLFTITTEGAQNLMDYLTAREIMVRPFWVPMNMLPMYSNCLYVSGSHNISNEVHSTALSIPCSTSLDTRDQDYVIRSITDYYK